MTVREIAEAFAALCREGKWDEAGERFWSDDVVSIEAMEGPMARCAGREALKAKSAWWMENHEVHAAVAHGPYVNGEQFAMRFAMDVTPRETGERTQMEEVGLYTVSGGRIIEERFFY